MAAPISEARDESQRFPLRSQAIFARTAQRKFKIQTAAGKPLPEKDLYLSICLVTKELDPASRTRIEELGVSCLMDCRPYQAYGIITDSKALIARIEQDPAVAFVEVEEPPCTK